MVYRSKWNDACLIWFQLKDHYDSLSEQGLSVRIHLFQKFLCRLLNSIAKGGASTAQTLGVVGKHSPSLGFYNIAFYLPSVIEGLL